MNRIIEVIKQKPQVIGLLIMLIVQALSMVHVIVPTDFSQHVIDLLTILFGGATAYKSEKNNIM